MSASEFETLDRILKNHEDELIEEALAELPAFVVERRPRVMFENNGAALGRWLCSAGHQTSTGSKSAASRTTS